MPTIDGLVTGIDTQSIIDGLLQVGKTQTSLLTARQAEIKTKQAVYASIKDKITTLRSQAATLGKTQNSIFNTRKSTVSDESALSATVSSTAAAGVYRLKVNSLAQAHQVATQVLPDADSEITQGTITLRAGSRSPVTITVDSTNNTLSGLATAINDANAGLSASIVEDGSGARIVLTAEKTGTANAISITSNLAASSGNATQPAFDFGNPVQAATDASVTLGSGTGAVTVTSDTNRISTLIGGVDLNLANADPAKTITLTVTRDTEPATKAVNDFVTSYNDLMDFLSKQTSYDAGTQSGGPLLGDSQVSTIRNQIQTTILGTVSGVSGQVNRLSSIGVTVGDTGQLTFNSSKLTSILNGSTPGVSADDVRRLFSLDATSTNSGIRYVSGSNRTADSSTPYEVNITQAATQASVTAAGALGASTVIDGSNNSFSLTVDGKSTGSLTIASGTYTQDQLAGAIEKLVNSSPDLGGRTVRVAVVANQLQITSPTYGSSSEVRLSSSGTANATLGLDGTEAGVGKNVAGNFVINGEVEEATGSGRLLTGKSTNKFTADLQLRVSLTDAQIVAGSEGTMTVTRGLAGKLDQLLGKMLDPVTGDLKSVDDGFQGRVDDIQKTIDKQKALMESQEARIRAQFSAMEAAVQSLQNTATLLGGQLESLNSSK